MSQKKKPYWDKTPLNIVTAERLLETLKGAEPWRVDEDKLYSRLELRWAPDYAEPGYSLEEDQKAVLLGNWNRLSKNAFDLVEKSFALEWCDEWAECSECAKTYRTQPDDMCWSPSSFYSEAGCAELCLHCILEDPSQYLEEVSQDGLSYCIVQAIVEQGLPEGWSLLEDKDSFNGTPRNVKAHYEEEGFDKVLSVNRNGYDFKWILGFKEDEEDI